MLYSLKTAESALYEPNLYFKVTNKTFNFQNTIHIIFFFNKSFLKLDLQVGSY